MTVFWTVWACFIVGLLVLASFIEIDGVRKRINGANGFILFSCGYLTLLSSPVPFIVTWVWRDFGTAVVVCAIGGVAYAALFAAVLQLLGRVARTSS
ncbi:MAG: hypothetical protein JWP72_2320 [Massilia sp.]|nr:hypothetical protein [Massilia sp.]